MERIKTSDIVSRNAFFTRTTADVTGVTTYIDIEANGIKMFKDGDSFLFCDVNGSIYPLIVNGDVSPTGTRINIVSYDFGTDEILAGALVSFDSIDMFREYQRKTKGTVAGMPVSGDTLGPIQYTGVNYIGNFDELRGVDLDFISILPSDFMNNSVGTHTLIFNDASASGLAVQNHTIKPVAFIRIPFGKKATHVDVYGPSNNLYEVYEMNLNASTNLTTATDLLGGTGKFNTQQTLSSEVDSTSTNYLLIRADMSSKGSQIYGGKVTIDNI